MDMKIINKIHENDTMFNESIDHYLNTGKELCSISENAIIQQHKNISLKDIKVLELPAGFGRVTRHLINVYSSSNITTVDIYDDALDFQSKTFNTTSIKISIGDFEYKAIKNNYFDLGIMGSLVTHFDEKSSRKIILAFMNKIKTDGIGVITIHGNRSYDMLKEENIYQVSEIDRSDLLQAYNSGKYGFCNYISNHTFEKYTVEATGSSYGISLIPKN